MGLRGIGAKSKITAAVRAAQDIERLGGRIESEYKLKPWEGKRLSRTGRIIRFLESLKITSGILAGKRFKVRPWQRKIINAWYRTDKKNQRIVRTGIFSVARKNGKTGLVAALALCHLLGPEQEPRGQIVVGATDRDQSGLIFEELEAYILDNPQFLAECNIKKHEKVIEHLPSGSKFRALSSDAKKAHGLSPSVVILDELAQWGTGIGRGLYDALTTAGGARKEPLTLVIGTQSPDEHNLMSELIDYAKTAEDETFVGFIYEIASDLDVFDESNWKLANPALGDFRSLDDMRVMAERAKRIPTLRNTFRNLFCNQRVAEREKWISPELWDACKRESPIEDIDILGAGPCYGGLDLGSTQDLTALALFWPLTGYLKVWSWCPEDNIAVREERDRVPYRLWRDLQYIEPTPGIGTDKRIVANRLAQLWAKYRPQSIAFDRWGMPELIRILSEEGMPEIILVPWDQGMRTMSPAMKAFEERVLNQKLTHEGNPVLDWAVSNVEVEGDAAGNQKPSKARSREKIDPIVASIMAVGLATVGEPEYEPQFFILGE